MGFLFMPTNRTITSTCSIDVGTAVSGYPIDNLNDYAAWNQAEITPSAGNVRILVDIGTGPVTGTDPAYLVGALGLVNHNLDGVTLELRSHSAASWAAATVRLAPFTLNSYALNANMLYALSQQVAARYWYLNLTGAPTPVRIGVLGLGPTWDLGQPENGWEMSPEARTQFLRGDSGYELGAPTQEPTVREVYRFTDPDQLTKALMYDRTLGGSGYLAYAAFLRHMRQRRDRSNSGAGTALWTGLSAGSGAPMFYHQGTENGLSNAGRPAFYARMKVRAQQAEYRQVSPLTIEVEHAFPYGADVAPGTF